MPDEDMLVYPEEFKCGMREELEHTDVTGGDKDATKKIVLAHLKEDPKYYSKLGTVMKAEEVSILNPKYKTPKRPEGYKMTPKEEVETMIHLTPAKAEEEYKKELDAPSMKNAVKPPKDVIGKPLGNTFTEGKVTPLLKKAEEIMKGEEQPEQKTPRIIPGKAAPKTREYLEGQGLLKKAEEIMKADIDVPNKTQKIWGPIIDKAREKKAEVPVKKKAEEEMWPFSKSKPKEPTPLPSASSGRPNPKSRNPGEPLRAEEDSFGRPEPKVPSQSDIDAHNEYTKKLSVKTGKPQRVMPPMEAEEDHKEDDMNELFSFLTWLVDRGQKPTTQNYAQYNVEKFSEEASDEIPKRSSGKQIESWIQKVGTSAKKAEPKKAEERGEMEKPARFTAEPEKC